MNQETAFITRPLQKLNSLHLPNISKQAMTERQGPFLLRT